MDRQTSGPRALHRELGLTDLVLRSGKPWLLDSARLQDLVRDGTLILRGVAPLAWLGVPLAMDGRTLGMLAVQSYSGAPPFTQADLELLRFVSGQIAACLERQRAEEERKLLAHELLHAQKLESLGSLAGGVAHDMNNILGAIQAVTQTLRASHAQDAGLMASIGTIERASIRGRDLVRGLSDFARKDLREACPLDLNDLVRGEAELLSRTLLQRIRLDVDLEAGLPLVLGESSALGSALMNLCVNAVDAMPAGGALAISTRSLAGALVELTVADTGSGMEPDVLARALEPFYTTKPYGKGTGLGLAMVYSLKAHGGTVTLESAPGRGTSVHLRLPARPDLILPGPSGQLSDAALEPLRILLVDDDELIREAAPELLELRGHEVVTAASGAEGLDRLEEGPPYDVLVLDVNMPGMGGLETLSLLRRRWPDLPVVLATGFVGKTVKAALAEDPMLLALAKPYSLEEVQAKLQEAMKLIPQEGIA